MRYLVLAMVMSPLLLVQDPPRYFRDVDLGQSDHYTPYLVAAAEPVLDADFEGEAYRFLWLRSFDAAVVVRLTSADGKFGLDGMMFGEPNTPDEYQVVRRSHRWLKKEEWERFQKKLQDADFWTMDTDAEVVGRMQEEGQRNAPPGTEFVIVRADGSDWLLEGKASTVYHAADRWSPREADPFREVCLYLIELSDLLTSDDDVY